MKIIAKSDKKQAYRQNKVAKGWRNVSFLHDRRKLLALALGIVTWARQEVTLLSNESCCIDTQILLVKVINNWAG